jgi:hypothetical protein
MKANLTTLKFGIVALVAVAGAIGAAACSSDDSSNNPGPSLEAGTTSSSGGSSGASSSGSSSGGSGGSSSSSSSGGSSSSSSSSGGNCTPDASANCNSCSTIANGDPSHACSPFGCAGFYDNAAHNVPNPVPSP